MKKVIVVYVIVILLLLLMVERVWQLPYLYKTLIKIPLFTVMPYAIGTKLGFPKLTFKLKGTQWKELGVIALIFMGLLCMGFFIIYQFVDAGPIKNDIYERMAVPSYMIVTAVLYTTFVNSFIEEVMFRGFVFLNFKHIGAKRMGYMLSALFFMAYHVAIIGSWFSWPLMVLAMIGLFAGGLIFGFFTDRYDSLIGSWVMHIVADAVIIGLSILFFKIV